MAEYDLISGTQVLSNALSTFYGGPRLLTPKNDSPFRKKPDEQDVLFLQPRFEQVRKLVYRYVTYDELSKLREVCRGFNRDASAALIEGFRHFSKNLQRERATLKKELPRRESDRRKHPLFSYSETIACLETRKDILEMTYKRYIDKDLITFIPGKALDEGWRLLGQLRAKKHSTERNMHYELVKDFRDLTTMAIDHFEDQISPALKKAEELLLTNALTNCGAYQPSLMPPPPITVAKPYGLDPPVSYQSQLPLHIQNFQMSCFGSPSFDSPLHSKVCPSQPPRKCEISQTLEQEKIIRMQNDKITALTTTVGVLITTISQMGAFVNFPVPTENLMRLLLNQVVPLTDNANSGADQQVPPMLPSTPRGPKRPLDMPSTDGTEVKRNR